MSNLTFKELKLVPEMQKAIDAMGFEESTEIQSRGIPLIRTGVDVIGRSQTGTGKTIAFSIPAIEQIDIHEDKPTVQVIILTPTRELAQQGADEISKLTRYMKGITVADVYGGAAMDRQIAKLKKANIVIGTPGRIMDHMRRKTLKLDNIKMVVLDEADEMLSMGFVEDIETILETTPETRQTVLFSATMPTAILNLTKQFQKNPQMIQVNSQKVTLDNIKQIYVDVPMGRKNDALKLLLHFYKPNLCMIFCNTRQMVDEITDSLVTDGFRAEGLHGEMKQSQRTKVMNGFKHGGVSILVCTDVAARGIDVNDVDYVINYDIPQNIEYYVHRIGRTGRAGKSGIALTICSGRKQVITLQNIAHSVKSKITEIEIPTVEDIHKNGQNSILDKIKEAIDLGVGYEYTQMVATLESEGISATEIAAALISMNDTKELKGIKNIVVERKHRPNFATNGSYSKLVVDIGRASRVAPNHIVAAMTERTALSGADIGKIEIYDDFSVISVPSDAADSVIEDMIGGKICGKPVRTSYQDIEKANSRRGQKRGGNYKGGKGHSENDSKRQGNDSRRQGKYQKNNKIAKFDKHGNIKKKHH